MKKTVLITGATSGIGLATALRLADLGHLVIATGRASDRLDRLREERPDVDVRVLDVTSESDFFQLEGYLRRDAMPEIDALYVNAAIHIEHPYDHGGARYAEWDQVKIAERTMAVNYTGVVRTVEVLRPHMNMSGEQPPRILFANGLLGSFAAHTSSDARIRDTLTIEHPHYSASKVALNMYMLHLARQRPEIFVASLNLGWVKTTIGGPDAVLTPERAAEHAVKYLVDPLGEALSGQFIGRHGKLAAF